MAHAAHDAPDDYFLLVEFARRRDGMIHAMDGGLWLHRHLWYGHAMAHLVSTDRSRLIAWGHSAGLHASRLQYKPLKDPRTNERRDAWHWDLAGPSLPPPTVPRPPCHPPSPSLASTSDPAAPDER
ncbi:MAG TPA: hypothetical protein VLE53_06070 [Gemmatimonadaceae bacterium]|nr:hypothetical protein [Gemmatimonadaceae bacterium]